MVIKQQHWAEGAGSRRILSIFVSFAFSACFVAQSCTLLFRGFVIRSHRQTAVGTAISTVCEIQFGDTVINNLRCEQARYHAKQRLLFLTKFLYNNPQIAL
jgi:hypothetical protein